MNEVGPDPIKIKRITEKILGLPTLPTVISKMIELVDNPRTSAASLASLISTDQALTARILKMANSAYYGFSREIYTVNMAIVVMGFNAVREMGLSLSVFDAFKDVSGDSSFDISEYWQHSIACGVASKMLANRYIRNFAGEAFVAGLLHDIGKLVLNQYLKNEFNAIASRIENNDEKLYDVERELLGTDHGEIGSWLSDKWKLPFVIVESIKYHHTPWLSEKNSTMVAIITIADHLAHMSGIGNGGANKLPDLDEKVWEMFESEDIGLVPDDLDDLQTEFLIEFDKTESMTSFIHE